MARSWLVRNGSVLIYGMPATTDRAAVIALIDDANGRRVLSCLVGHTDPLRPLHALAGLFSSVAEAELAALPPAHRRTLTEAVFRPSPTTRQTPPVTVLGPAVLSLLRVLSRSAPLLVVIEAVHRLDGDTRAVLRFVAERADDLPIRMVAVEEVRGVSAPAGHPLCPPPLVMIRLPQPLDAPSPN
jgi:hypothetical protein